MGPSVLSGRKIVLNTAEDKADTSVLPFLTRAFVFSLFFTLFSFRSPPIIYSLSLSLHLHGKEKKRAAILKFQGRGRKSSCILRYSSQLQYFRVDSYLERYCWFLFADSVDFPHLLKVLIVVDWLFCNRWVLIRSRGDVRLFFSCFCLLVSGIFFLIDAAWHCVMGVIVFNLYFDV